MFPVSPATVGVMVGAVAANQAKVPVAATPPAARSMADMPSINFVLFFIELISFQFYEDSFWAKSRLPAPYWGVRGVLVHCFSGRVLDHRILAGAFP
jgi:hypothetical protein